MSVTSSSSKNILPLVGAKSPLIRFSAVLFPQPDGPRRPISLPSGISKLKSLTAITSPLAFFPLAGNRLVRFLSTIFIHASSHRYFVYIGRTNSRRVLYYFSMLAVIFPPLSHNIRLASRIRTKKDSTAHRAMESQHQFIQLDKVALRLGVKDMNESCVEHELDPCMSCKCIEA